MDCGADLTRSWYVQFYALGVEGEMIRRRLTVHGVMAADRYRQAKLLIREIDAALRSGAVLVPKVAARKPTPALADVLPSAGPGAALAHLIKEQAGRWRKPTTDVLAVVARRVSEWAAVAGIAALPLLHVTPERWADFFQWLRTDYRSCKTGRPLMGAAFNCYHLRLTVLLNHLHQAGRYPYAWPLALVPTDRAEPTANQAYTDEQKARLLPTVATADPALQLLVQLMYYSMARPKELLRVRHVRADVIEVPADISKTRRLRFPNITPPLLPVLAKLDLPAAAPDHILISTGERPGPVALDGGRLSAHC